MGRWGMRRVLTLTLVVCALSIALLALVRMPVPGYIALGLIAGLSTPPVQSAVRTIYPKMVTSRQLTPLFSLDASLQELIWIIAPVVISSEEHTSELLSLMRNSYAVFCLKK